jgi:isopenicillin-N N-acyltransferase-like protein
MLTSYRQLIETSQDRLKLSWAEAVSHSRQYARFAPNTYLEELHGMAEGAGAELDDLLALNCMEAIVSDALHLKCTSLALGPEWTNDRHVLLAHNEDWWPQDELTLYLIHAEPEREPAFLALTYGGLLPAIGLNSAGLAQCCNSVYPNDSRFGVPRAFVARSVLAAGDLVEAARRAAHPDREAGYNHLVVNREGDILSLEASARRHAILPSLAGALVHTNHYLDPGMQEVERDPAGWVVRACATNEPPSCCTRGGRTPAEAWSASWQTITTHRAASAPTSRNLRPRSISTRRSPR